MKICVYGAGAIGGHVAARLAKGGAAVSVVARGPHLAAMQENGLRVRTPEEELRAEVKASADPAALGPQDAVVVTVKAPALPSVAAAIQPLLGPDTPVFFIMNGVPWFYFHRHGGPHDGMRLADLDPGNLVWDAIGPQRAVGGVVYSACTVDAPGVIRVETPRNRIILGEPGGGESPRSEALATILRDGGMTLEVTPRIRDAIWAKLLLNLAHAPVAVLTGAPPVQFYQDEAVRDVSRKILAEGAAIARAMGCEVTLDLEAPIRNSLKSKHKSSILQDLELGRPMEIDALLTAPLELARLQGVETPVLDMLSALVRARARAAGLYPD